MTRENKILQYLHYHFYRQTIAIALLLLSSCSGKPSSYDIDPYATFFELSGKKAHEKSYILGVSHVQVVDSLAFLPAVLEIFEEMDCVVTEIDLTDVETLSRALEVSDYVLPESVSYTDLLSAEDYYAINDYLWERGMGKLAHQRAKPHVLLRNLVIVDELGAGATIEIFFAQKALQSSKRNLGLESIGYQSDLMKQYSAAIKEETNSATLDSQLKQLLNYVKGMGHPERREMTQEGVKEAFDLLEVSKRNHRWVKKIKRIIKHDRALIIVGKGHLLGSEGLIPLLEKAGYEVAPIY